MNTHQWLKKQREQLKPPSSSISLQRMANLLGADSAKTADSGKKNPLSMLVSSNEQSKQSLSLHQGSVEKDELNQQSIDKQDNFGMQELKSLIIFQNKNTKLNQDKSVQQPWNFSTSKQEVQQLIKSAPTNIGGQPPNIKQIDNSQKPIHSNIQSIQDVKIQKRTKLNDGTAVEAHSTPRQGLLTDYYKQKEVTSRQPCQQQATPIQQPSSISATTSKNNSSLFKNAWEIQQTARVPEPPPSHAHLEPSVPLQDLQKLKRYGIEPTASDFVNRIKNNIISLGNEYQQKLKQQQQQQQNQLKQLRETTDSKAQKIPKEQKQLLKKERSEHAKRLQESMRLGQQLSAVAIEKRTKTQAVNQQYEEKFSEQLREIRQKQENGEYDNNLQIDLYNETAEQRKSFSALVRSLLSHKYFDEEKILDGEVKRIPEKFKHTQEYFSIFEYLYTRECYACLQGCLDSYNFAEHRPLKVNIKLITTIMRDEEGFVQFQLNIGWLGQAQRGQEEEDSNSRLYESEFNPVTEKNYLVLISSRQEVADIKTLSNTAFRINQPFLFMGFLVPPKDPSKASEFIKLKTEVGMREWDNVYYQTEKNVYLYPFEKISTISREYLAIKNIRYQQFIAPLLCEPHLLNSQHFSNLVDQPEVNKEFFQRMQMQYNESQFKAIQTICLLKEGIQLLQGPPGTGKTTTLLGIAAGLLHYARNQSDPELQRNKLLICAPSNAAIDEIIVRVSERGLPLLDKVKIVRVGTLNASAHASVKESSLEFQVQQKFNIEEARSSSLASNRSSAHPEQTLTELKLAVANINQQLEKHRNQEITLTPQQIDDLYERRRQTRASINQERLKKIIRRDRYNALMTQLLSEADIVLSTLNSIGSEKMQVLKGQFFAVIVDEAAQCTEPSNIIPLLLGMRKMVLIGDPKQLPATTFSRDTQTTYYNRSLFERILANKVKHYFLDTQYRMEPAIRQFPSDEFYNGRLKDGALSRQFPTYLKTFEARNLLFLDLLESRQSKQDNSYENRLECNLIVNLCHRLIQSSRQSEQQSIGIITPYKSQVRALNRQLRDINIRQLVQVNTVDSFQGQEKDIILLSTVRSSHEETNDASLLQKLIGFLSDERRMNVALTRARFVLVVVGNSPTLTVDRNWRKFIDFVAARGGYYKCVNQKIDFFTNKVWHDMLSAPERQYVKKEWTGVQKVQVVEELTYQDFVMEDICLDDSKIKDNEEVPPAEAQSAPAAAQDDKDELNLLKQKSGNLDIDTILKDEERANYLKTMTELQTRFEQAGSNPLGLLVKSYAQQQQAPQDPAISSSGRAKMENELQPCQEEPKPVQDKEVDLLQITLNYQKQNKQMRKEERRRKKVQN